MKFRNWYLLKNGVLGVSFILSGLIPLVTSNTPATLIAKFVAMIMTFISLYIYFKVPHGIYDESSRQTEWETYKISVMIYFLLGTIAAFTIDLLNIDFSNVNEWIFIVMGIFILIPPVIYAIIEKTEDKGAIYE